jgi:hypothetical protein
MSRFDEILADFGDKYDLSAISSPNDKANLNAFINIQVAVERLQQELQALIDSGNLVTSLKEVSQINSAIGDMLERSMQLERALALDRKSRTGDKAESTAEYIAELKIIARDFLRKQFITIDCPDCKIQLARIAPTLEHVGFQFVIQCSQCGKNVELIRRERDIFYDFAANDRSWRRKFKYEVIAQKKKDSPVFSENAELIIGDDEVEDGAET